MQQQQPQFPQQPVPQQQAIPQQFVPLPPQEWKNTLFGCFSDVPSCLEVFCCASCQVGRQCSSVEDKNDTQNWGCCFIACCFPVCMLVQICQIRGKVASKFKIDEGCVGNFVKGCFCPACSLCQTHRELSMRGAYPGGVCYVSGPLPME